MILSGADAGARFVFGELAGDHPSVAWHAIAGIKITSTIIVVAALSAVPAWLCGSILKKHAAKDGGAGSDWIPLSLLPYAVGRFQHRHKGAIVFGYLFGNLLFGASVIALFLVLKK